MSVWYHGFDFTPWEYRMPDQIVQTLGLTLTQGSNISPITGSSVSSLSPPSQFLWALLGSVVPSLIRLLAWCRLPPPQRRAEGIDLVGIGGTAVIQGIFALIAVSLLPVQTALAAAGIGYGAPEIIVRVFTALTSTPSAPKGSDIHTGIDPDRLPAGDTPRPARSFWQSIRLSARF
jgi:hypothetical protein